MRETKVPYSTSWASAAADRRNGPVFEHHSFSKPATEGGVCEGKREKEKDIYRLGRCALSLMNLLLVLSILLLLGSIIIVESISIICSISVIGIVILSLGRGGGRVSSLGGLRGILG